MALLEHSHSLASDIKRKRRRRKKKQESFTIRNTDTQARLECALLVQPRTSSGGLFTSCVIWARAHAIAPTCRSTISLHKHRCMEARKYYTTRVSCRLFISFCFRAQLSLSLFPSRYNACRRGSKSATPDSRSLICPIVEVRERAYTHIYGRVRVYIYREPLLSARSLLSSSI